MQSQVLQYRVCDDKENMVCFLEKLIGNAETVLKIAWSSDCLPIEHRRRTPSGLTVNW